MKHDTMVLGVAPCCIFGSMIIKGNYTDRRDATSQTTLVTHYSIDTGNI